MQALFITVCLRFVLIKGIKYHDVSGASNEITPPFPLGLHLCDCRKDDEGGRLVDSCSSEGWLVYGKVLRRFSVHRI